MEQSRRRPKKAVVTTLLLLLLGCVVVLSEQILQRYNGHRERSPQSYPVAGGAYRIVSLAPSLTEDLAALGLVQRLVGVDTLSNRPAPVRRITRIGSLRAISIEQIIALHPDLVVGIPYQEPVVERLRRLGVRAVCIPNDSLDDALSAIATLGELTGAQRQAQHLLAQLRAHLREQRVRARTMPWIDGIVPIGIDPLYVAGRGSYLDTLLTLAHVRNIGGTSRVPWPTLSEEYLLVHPPRLIVTASDTDLSATPTWRNLPAIRAGCVVRLNSDDLFRPGPHLDRILTRIVGLRVQRVCR